LVPVVLGTLLGNTMENNLRRAVTISNGDYMTLVHSPLAIGLWVVAIIGFVAPLFLSRMVRTKMHERQDHETSTPD
jgi:putative tricarboxylic transport membrane protein